MVPVTTPFLAGARVRSGSSSGIEVVVPSLSGSQGFYIIPLAGLLSFCAPTVHDAALLEYLTVVGNITPGTVRQVALRVAQEGYAGHDAAAVAQQATARDRVQLLRTRQRLAAGLVAQAQPAGGRTAAPVDPERGAELLLRRLGGALGAPPARLGDGLEALSEAFAPVGFGLGDNEARLPRLLRLMERTCLQFCDWIRRDRGHDVGGLGQAMQEPLRFACSLCADVLQTAQSHLENPLWLLRQWLAEPGPTIERALRPAWVMDGWDQFCSVWMSTDANETRRCLLLELPQYLPVMPAEVSGWTDLPIPPLATEQTCRVVSRDDSWRSGGAAFALIERNEKLRAWSL